nr:hypothetical protein [Parabacteroides goldsteinii]
MIDTENIKKFLPKYLSAESYKELIEGLRCFPENLDSRFYTDYLKEKIIYQGDGIKGFPTINFNTMEKKDCQAIVLSNTCDMDLANKRMFGSQIVYAPIIELEKYKSILMRSNISHAKINAHIDSIRSQELTQILYLPQYGSCMKESIVFLDRIFNVDNAFINRDNLNETRIFSLSDYGNYVLLLKISIHFTRMQDKVDRKSTHI